MHVELCIIHTLIECIFIFTVTSNGYHPYNGDVLLSAEHIVTVYIGKEDSLLPICWDD